MNPPREGIEKTAYWAGFNGRPNDWQGIPAGNSAWKQGRADRDSQTSVADLAAGVVDELMGKTVNHLKTRRRDRPD